MFLIWASAFWGVRALLWVGEYQLEQTLETRMEKADESSLLVSFAILRKDSARLFHWEHSREFAYQGQMYDVLERRVDGDSLHLRCYWDQAESSFKRQAGKLQQQPMAPVSDTQQVGLLCWVRPCLVPGTLSYGFLLPLGEASSFHSGELRSDQVALTPPHAPPNYSAIL